MATEESTELHHAFMREALAMAQLALRSSETPVGCVFVRDEKIIARGMNETNRSLNGTRHAEFVALEKILKSYPTSVLSESNVYVTVEPCVMCASALRQHHVRKVFYGCINKRFGGNGGVFSIHSDPGSDLPYPVHGGIYQDEAILLLREFYLQENGNAPEPRSKKNRELNTEMPPLIGH